MAILPTLSINYVSKTSSLGNNVVLFHVTMFRNMITDTMEVKKIILRKENLYPSLDTTELARIRL